MARNNVLCMREEEFQAAAAGFGRSASSIASAGQGVPGKFSGATNSGLMGTSVSTVARQMGALSSSIGNIQGIINKHSNQMFGYDRTMAKMANDIEIPQDFLANNSMEVNTYNRTLLGKIDGKSVNEGETATEFKEIDDSTVVRESLSDIRGTDSVEEKYDASSIIGKSVLGNISGNQTEAQNYDDKVSVQRANMENISGDQTKAQDYDDKVSVQKANMQNISGNQTQQQQLDESTVIGKSVLGNVNKNSETQRQELDTSTTIATTNLTGVGTDGVKVDPGKAYDEVMAETQNLAGASFATMVNSQTPEKKKTEKEHEDVDFD